jgi:hypothetical protein
MLDATVGGATSNSYGTLEEAQAYMATHVYGAEWLDLDVEVQEQSLIMATRQLEALCYLGTKATAEQALKWPRKGLTYDGHAVPSDVVPAAMKAAEFEQARLTSKTDPTAPLDAEMQGLKRIQAGSVELEFKDGVKTQGVPSTVTGVIPASWRCPTPEELALLGTLKNRKAEFAVI